METKKKVKAELAETRRKLQQVAEQRDTLLVYCVEKGEVPPGTWGPFTRMVTMPRKDGGPTLYFAPGDTLTVEDPR